MARSKSSKRWLAEHRDDPFVQRAHKEGWRGRAAFKLIELDDKYRLLPDAGRVVDLGAAPGAWCQVARQRMPAGGQLFALDILPMEPLAGVSVIEGDFTEDEPLQRLEALLDGQALELVLSDMAPNMSGMRVVDQPRAMYLAELALEFALQWLRPGGNFVCKVFQGTEFDVFLARCREEFDRVLVRKPASSRPRSREVYILGLGRKLK